ncbi:hypothetical protein T552_00496 [Pneumocystis carinii B80]|uniref:Phosphatidylinositol N-acetylglucosaminyltransferase n=1 Tax=Pneumocystis carinii (strain B80) TaxID=1408658 RepID=A0A0W4ZQZ6_PNEC8|nr:hypothetical protein T552_00496 [Pneumocystis carinii B80]KTW30784.1 hypothetical protein T552_00496 [Pneumocystis carinii B80]
MTYLFAEILEDIKEEMYYKKGTNHIHSKRKKKWRKLLWVKQDYPDNWVDESFLKELKRNVNVKVYDFLPLVADMIVFMQHLCSIAIFICAFISIYYERVSPGVLIGISTGFTICCYIFWDLGITKFDYNRNINNRKEIAKFSILIILVIFCVSPILESLTKSTTSDSIWALTFCLFLANIFFHDYSTAEWANKKFPGSLSTNAGVMASVVLASQLTSYIHAFSLIVFAVEWFALFPMFRRYLRQNFSFTIQLILTAFLLTVASILITLEINFTLTLLFLFSFFFISFVCPLWLISLQKYKSEIHGPWDIAKPKFGNSSR